MKFKVDPMRGIAYKGNNGYFIQLDSKGLSINKNGKKVILDSKNSKTLSYNEIIK